MTGHDGGKRRLSPRQPKKGDVIIHCGHLNVDGHHFFSLPGGDRNVWFVRPDGTRGEAAWIVACDDCWRAADGNPAAIKIHGDGIWNNDDPILYEGPTE